MLLESEKVDHCALCYRLLHKRLLSKTPVGAMNPFEWDQIDQNDLRAPLGDETTIYPLIWGINLAGEKEANDALLEQLEKLDNYSSG